MPPKRAKRCQTSQWVEARKPSFCAVPLAKVSEPPMMTCQYLMWLLLLVTHGPFVDWRPMTLRRQLEGLERASVRKDSGRKERKQQRRNWNHHQFGLCPTGLRGKRTPPAPPPAIPSASATTPIPALSWFQGPHATFPNEREQVGLIIQILTVMPDSRQQLDT